MGLLALPLALSGCGGGGISGRALAECISATGRETYFDKNQLLVFDTVEVRTTDTKASIYLYDDGAGRAKEEYESDRFDTDPEDRGRLKLVDNAEVVWDEVPSSDDDQVHQMPR
jgi:hypothetical protein